MIHLSILLSVLVPSVIADDAYELNELGLIFDSPGESWTRVGSEATAGGGQEHAWRRDDDEDWGVSLIVWRLRGHELPGLCATELEQMGARGEVEELRREERMVAGIEALSTRYRLDRPEPDAPLLFDSTWFQAEEFLGRVSVELPEAEAEELDALVRSAIEAVRLEGPWIVPFEYGEPDSDHVLTVVTGEEGPELALRYLEALPGAARAMDGLPVILAVGPNLGPAARAFLEKYRPGEIRCLGPVPVELPQAVSVTDEWPTGGEVVVCEPDLGDPVQAACLALRLGIPLVIDRGDLAERLERLEPSRLLAVGAIDVSRSGIPIERLRDPVEIARAAGGADYLAVGNVAAGEGAGAAALAATLAGVRGGVVLPIDQRVVRHRIPLQRTEECPPGLEEIESMGHYLLGSFERDGEEIYAGAAQTAEVRVATDSSPRYGRLRVDLDGDGRLDGDEEPRIGSTIRLGDRSFHLTYHYAHAFVPYFRDELILDELDPNDLRDRIRHVTAPLGTISSVALVGTPDLIPFCYREATGYFEAYDIKQELPTDAPYADLDGDAYLELAVGRLPVETLTEGSAKIATTVAYPLLKGDWPGEATVIQPGFHELEGALPWVLPNAEALIRGIEGDLVAAGARANRFYREDVEIDETIEAIARSGWIAYFNHSGPGSWGIHPGAAIVTCSTGNGADRTLPALEGAPIVFGGGCSSGALDVGHELEATFPGRFFQLGAVAYLGNTRVAYARSEHLIQLFFARLAADGSTLGEAYRDGRNLLAHLLEAGHLLDPLDHGIELGTRDFLWGQHHIMNLFGDPELQPRLPRAGHSPIEVELATTNGPDRLRLGIVNRGTDRRDPVWMMPASGQGSPREFFVRTGPGMTSSHLPYNYAGAGLAPVRSILDVQPGAWIDVELPHDVRVEEMTLVTGPGWCDRGFAVRPGSRGEARLLAFVPLVRASLEEGAGDVARRVEFDLLCEPPILGSSDSPVPRQDRPRFQVEKRWTPEREGEPRIAEEAREILDRIRDRYDRSAPGACPIGIEWTMENPQPRLYGSAHFRGAWGDGGRATLAARNLPSFLEPRREEIEQALRDVADLPFTSPLPPIEGHRVEVASKGVLVLTPLAGEEPDVRTEVFTRADGTIERLVEAGYGLTRVTRFEWRETEHGPVLERRVALDPVRPEKEMVHEVEYTTVDGLLLPTRITLKMIGILPDDVRFELRYPGGSRAIR